MNNQATVAETIHEFAISVRAELSDLGPREVEELTEGLEVDLLEQAMAEDETGGWNPGEPKLYAQELRSAAGLPLALGAHPGHSANR